jgi:hypothetical protein
MLDPPDVFMVRNEFVLRLFLLSTLDKEDARKVLRPVVAESRRELAALSQAIEGVDAAQPAGETSPFGRLAAEYGVRSMRTVHDWALWALDRIDHQSRGARGRCRS